MLFGQFEGEYGNDHWCTHYYLQRGCRSRPGIFRDILGLQSVDAGHGWLIFGLPPAEAAFHPADRNGAHALYFMSNDLKPK